MTWPNLTMPNQTVKNGPKAKKIKLSQMNFFLEKQLLKLSCTCCPLSFCKILKKFIGPIQSYEDVPFSGPKWPVCNEQIFLGTNHYYYFHLPVGLFHCANFKKFLQWIQSYEDVPFLSPNWSFRSPGRHFFSPPVSMETNKIFLGLYPSHFRPEPLFRVK